MKRFLLIIALVVLSPIASAKDDVCASWLSGPAGKSSSYHLDALKRHFAENRQLLFQEDAEPAHGSEFFASNEFDFLKGDVDHTHADLIVGFATNNVWDVAVRRKAKAMIIGDIISGPLLGQEYILRPIFELAKTRTEFLSMLTGIPVRTEHENLADIFDQLAIHIAQTRATNPEYVESILKRVNANPKFGPVYAQALARNYRTVDLLKAGTESPDQPIFEEDGTPALYPGDRAYVLAILPIYFHGRYSPDEAPRELKEKARQAARDPFFSFLASEEAYEFLRQMFIGGHVYYVRSDFANQQIYQSAAQLMKQHGYSSLAITTSNIADVVGEDEPDISNRIYTNYVRVTTNTLRTAGVRGPIPFMQTRGCQGTHEFECHIIPEGALNPKLQFKSATDPFLKELMRALGSAGIFRRASGE